MKSTQTYPGQGSKVKSHLTIACSSTVHALSVCMNVRSSHFTMQTAIACTSTEAGVRLKAAIDNVVGSSVIPK